MVGSKTGIFGELGNLCEHGNESENAHMAYCLGKLGP